MKKLFELVGSINPHVKKLLVIMRLSVFLILIAVFSSSASVYSQATKLTLKMKNATISEVFDEIEDQSEFIFFYNRDAFNDNKVVSVDFKDKRVEEILEELFQGQSVSYEIFDRNILIKASGKSPANTRTDIESQQRSVSGRVTDINNQPLPGVSIIIRGTVQGTVTNVNGEYTLGDIPDNAVLIFSFVGMRSQEVPVGNQTNINVTLEEEMIGLEEVAVIGYSSKKRSELSSSITVVSGEELNQQSVASTSLSAKLQGRVPGMIVSGTSGDPGSGAEMIIQGRGSLQADSDPLTVVDGIIGGSYDPKDIESITILRDAAATGLYGSRAANGVIVVTTKKGTPGDFKVSVNSLVGPTFNWDDRVKLQDAQGLYDYWSQAMKNLFDLRVSEGDPAFLNTTFEEYRNAALPSNVLDYTTDWYGLLTRPGFMNQHNIALSGGSERTTFYVSGTYNYEKGTYLDDYDREFNFRTNISHKISDRVNANLRMTYRYGQNPESSNGPQWQAWDNVPLDAAYMEDGVTPTRVMDTNKTPVWFHWTRNNYFLEREQSENWRRNWGTTLMGEVSWQITNWARFNTANRASLSGYDDPEYYSSITRHGYTPKGYVTWQQGNGLGYITSNTLHLTQDFGQHSIGGILGHEYNYGQSRWVRGRGHGMVGTMTALSSAGSPNEVGGDMSEQAFLSYFGQVDYDFQDKYFLVGSLRYDASSVFGEEKRWGTFYSIGGNWVLSKENFLRDVPWLDILKLRASYGTTGNADISNYLWMGTYSFTNKSSYDLQPGAWPARLPNPVLTWEIARKTNVGIDIGILQRATLEVNVYHKINDDLLQSVPLEATTGFTSQVRNIGSIQNNGIDFNLSGTVIDRKIKWSSNLNITFNKNKVLELYGGKDIIDENQIIREGLPLQSYFMREWLGIDPQTGKNIFTRWEDEEGNRLDGNETDDPYKVTTTQIYEEASVIHTGDAYPIGVGGFSNHIDYSNFYVDIITNFAFGQKIESGSDFFVHDIGANELKKTKWQKDFVHWEKPGDEATFAQIIYGDPYDSRSPSTRDLWDASYLRFQRVIFGYIFPYDVVGIKNLNINASIENLAVITAFPWGDSDTSFESPSTGASRYRPTRKFLINLSFTL